ncbi:hypothetical protein RchiOBHm_Chr1g0318911 [Rosa chinensis]|uniref:Uncharacterized protein n=1 Tax=Rosa chinensis TaxID=74649 RepID=A0A2P6S8E3_ROSCH|nr:hypothetical protein RchiOBHm_Chr1g0318911 [Rosa chinensis]
MKGGDEFRNHSSGINIDSFLLSFHLSPIYDYFPFQVSKHALLQLLAMATYTFVTYLGQRTHMCMSIGNWHAAATFFLGQCPVEGLLSP